VEQGGASFRTLNVYRDIYYTTNKMGNSQGNAQGAPFTVPEGQYFALGDNSSNSSDSRTWGTFPRENLIGRACFVFFPVYPIYDVDKKRLEWHSRLKIIR
jgi:signal peptidase I